MFLFLLRGVLDTFTSINPSHSCLFIPRPKDLGGYSDEPGVRPSSVRLFVRPSVNIFVSAQQLEYRLECFDDTSVI